MRPLRTALTLALLAAPTVSFAQQWPPPPPPDGQLAQQPQMGQQPGGQMVVQQPDGTVAVVQPANQVPYNMVTGPEPDSVSARLQLVTVQGLNGMGIGLSLAMLSNTEQAGVYGGAMILGAGAGVASAAIFTRDGITQGQASAINNGTIFGGLASTFLLFGAAPSLSRQAVGGIFTAGLTLGTAGGIIAALQRPVSGRVEFASSLGLWGAFTGVHLFLGTQGYGTFGSSGDKSLQVFGFTSLAAMGAGLTVGALLAPNMRLSGARVRWINLSGLTGYAVVGLSALAFSSGSGEGNTILSAYSFGSIAGAAAGLALGVYLTNDTDTMWNSQSPQRQARRGFDVNVMPGGPYGTPGATLGGTF